MFRYIGLVWNPENVEQSAVAKQITARLRSSGTPWTPALANNGLSVFCRGLRAGQNEIYRLNEGHGVVLGKIFRRQSLGMPSSTVSAIDERDTREIRRSGGHHLSQTFWGRYVSFWQADGATFVFRDPSGAFPCYEMTLRGVRIYFSWLQDCLDGTNVTPSINWDYIRVLLPLAILQSRMTALQEVTQVLQGEQVRFKADVTSTQLCWDPHQIARTEPIDDAKTAAHLLRAVTRDCVHHWADCYDAILLRLSGGIDSSIVAACLRDAPGRPVVTCLTHFTERAESDERSFARLMASTGPFEILEHKQEHDVRLDDLVRTAPTVVPRHCAPAIQSDRIEARAAERVGAGAIFGGGGGDQIFYQSSLGLAATDYLALKGLRPGVFPVALSAARAQRTSVWFVLRDALRDYRRWQHWNPLSDVAAYRQLLPRELIEAARVNKLTKHPWIAQTGVSPPGKTFHIHTMASPADYYDPRGQEHDAEYVHPLFSQPIIETVLRTPTYVLTHGGWDRALARRAFREDLPTEIAMRRTKGILNEYVKDVIRKNLGFIRASLLDGALTQHDLLDRRKLDEALSGTVTLDGMPAVELLDYLSIEHWIRSGGSNTNVAAA